MRQSKDAGDGAAHGRTGGQRQSDNDKQADDDEFDHPRPTFDRAVTEQNAKLSEGKRADMQALLSKGQTWTVEKSNTVFD